MATLTIETTKPDEMPAPSVQHASNGTTEHSLSDNVVAQRGKESEKAVRDDHNPNPTSNILATLPQQSPLEPWREAGLGDHRRKRRKTASAEEGIAKKASVHPRAQRRRKASDSFHSSAASNELDLIQGRIAFGSDRKSEKVSENHGRIHGPTARRLIKDAPWLPEAHLKISEEQPSTTVVHGTTEEKSILKDHVLYNKPKKILHFNPKTGTIGSPPAKKLTASFAATNKPLSSSRSKHPKSKVVKIGYGQGEASSSAIGFQVDQVLNGVKRIEPPLKKKGSSSRMKGLSTPGAKDVPEIANPEIKSTLAATIAPRMPAAPIHPFFSEKPITKPTNAEETANANASTLDIETQKPVSLGRTQLASRSRPPEITKPRSSALTGFLGFGNSTKMVKFPGAIEPAWPWKGMVHVRGVEIVQRDDRVRIDAASDVRSRSKKSKYQATEILAKEDVLLTVTATLGVNQVVKSIRNMNLDDHPPLPVCLRIPKKHLESGRELQKRIREELHARLPRPKFVSDGESSGEDIRECGLGHTSTHPALSRAFASIAVSLTAFDQFRYETRPWTHKHAPRCAAEVLQPGKEAVILKEWLQKLIVISVETRASDPPETRASCTSKSSAASNPDPLEKRKRKSKKLAGFVVSSDEDDNDMDEISEAEDSASACGSQTPLKKTIIRQGDVAAKGAKDTKLMNAVVISGPHGCGKTATVYAVANELGFEVFEINSSSKRSGKDILERVGDMTRNHLVQRSHDKAPSASQDEDSQRIADAFEDDIKSGRQGTMDSFFKHKVRAKAKSKLKKLQPQTKTSNRVQVSLASKGQTNQQKQSLILFEEADILYEEDKQFWSTVIALIIQSKRPIIMTCQDESFLPMQTLSLHAILRFTPPSIDLATDYMLLVAANEGHALQRNAVKALYQGRHLDLRASITELNFWCQFAVGDVKGGLEWLCPRWPLGCDVDKHGKIIRVVSEKTYEAGMGWFSQDFLESHIHYLDIEEETLHEAKDGWNVDLGHWQESIDMTSWAEKIHDSSRSKVDNPAYLKMYDDFADAMSVADLLSGSAFGAENRVRHQSRLSKCMLILPGRTRLHSPKTVRKSSRRLRL